MSLHCRTTAPSFGGNSEFFFRSGVLKLNINVNHHQHHWGTSNYESTTPRFPKFNVSTSSVTATNSLRSPPLAIQVRFFFSKMLNTPPDSTMMAMKMPMPHHIATSSPHQWRQSTDTNMGPHLEPLVFFFFILFVLLTIIYN
jgi:hypothetical protein